MSRFPAWWSAAVLVVGAGLPACTVTSPGPDGSIRGATRLTRRIERCPARLMRRPVSVELFARPGSSSCLRPRTLMAYRCTPRSDPVALASGRTYVGGRFAVPSKGALQSSQELGLGPGGSRVSLAQASRPRLVVTHGQRSARWLLLPRPAETPAARPTVHLVGDSIMVGSRRRVEAALRGWDATFDAVVGRSTAGGLAAVEPLGSRLGDAAVIELGTNDRTRVGFARRARRLLERIHDTPLVVWVTVHGPAPVPPVNGMIRTLASRFPNTEVADWDAAVPADGLQEDGIHPNHLGKLVVANLLERVLDPWRAAVRGHGDRRCEHTVRSIAQDALR